MPTVSRVSFRGLNASSKLDVLYDELVALQDHTKGVFDIGDGRMEELEKAVKKIKSRKIINTGASAFGGFLGGMVAVWLKRVFGG